MLHYRIIISSYIYSMQHYIESFQFCFECQFANVVTIQRMYIPKLTLQDIYTFITIGLNIYWTVRDVSLQIRLDCISFSTNIGNNNNNYDVTNLDVH